MSRSYKKYPCSKDGGPTRVKFTKREANKKVRRTDNIPSGKSYRRVFEPYDIHDYISRWTWEDAKFEYFHPDMYGIVWQEDYPTLKDFYKYWRKYYFSK